MKFMAKQRNTRTTNQEQQKHEILFLRINQKRTNNKQSETNTKNRKQAIQKQNRKNKHNTNYKNQENTKIRSS